MSRYLLDTSPLSPNNLRAKQAGWTLRCDMRCDRRYCIANPLSNVAQAKTLVLGLTRCI